MKHLTRHCPMCKGNLGIVISRSVNQNIRPVLGLCLDCGYAIRWALIACGRR